MTIPVNPPKDPTVAQLGNSLKEAVEAAKVPAVEPIATATDEQAHNIEDYTENDVINMPFLEARPLGFADFLNVTPLNKKFYYRWVSKNKQRFATTKAQGFILARWDDVKVSEEAKQEDGTIAFDDVILMKLPKERYLAAMKWHHQNAERQSSKAGVDTASIAEAEKAINSVKGPNSEIRKKVSAYIPKIQ